MNKQATIGNCTHPITNWSAPSKLQWPNSGMHVHDILVMSLTLKVCLDLLPQSQQCSKKFWSCLTHTFWTGTAYSRTSLVCSKSWSVRAISKFLMAERLLCFSAHPWIRVSTSRYLSSLCVAHIRHEFFEAKRFCSDGRVCSKVGCWTRRRTTNNDSYFVGFKPSVEFFLPICPVFCHAIFPQGSGGILLSCACEVRDLRKTKTCSHSMKRAASLEHVSTKEMFSSRRANTEELKYLFCQRCSNLGCLHACTVVFFCSLKDLCSYSCSLHWEAFVFCCCWGTPFSQFVGSHFCIFAGQITFNTVVGIRIFMQKDWGCGTTWFWLGLLLPPVFLRSMIFHRKHAENLPFVSHTFWSIFVLFVAKKQNFREFPRLLFGEVSPVWVVESRRPSFSQTWRCFSDQRQMRFRSSLWKRSSRKFSQKKKPFRLGLWFLLFSKHQRETEELIRVDCRGWVNQIGSGQTCSRFELVLGTGPTNMSLNLQESGGGLPQIMWHMKRTVRVTLHLKDIFVIFESWLFLCILCLSVNSDPGASSRIACLFKNYGGKQVSAQIGSLFDHDFVFCILAQQTSNETKIQEVQVAKARSAKAVLHPSATWLSHRLSWQARQNQANCFVLLDPASKDQKTWTPCSPEGHSHWRPVQHHQGDGGRQSALQNHCAEKFTVHLIGTLDISPPQYDWLSIGRFQQWLSYASTCLSVPQKFFSLNQKNWCENMLEQCWSYTFQWRRIQRGTKLWCSFFFFFREWTLGCFWRRTKGPLTTNGVALNLESGSSRWTKRCLNYFWHKFSQFLTTFHQFLTCTGDRAAWTQSACESNSKCGKTKLGTFLLSSICQY